MTLEQIKAAVESGQQVCWKNDCYRIVNDSIGQWLIQCSNGHCIGLTWRDGITMNGKPEDFYVEDDAATLAALGL